MSSLAAIKQVAVTHWPLAVVLLLHTILQLPHLPLDFWNDELYTLERFVLRPALQTASDYHTTNNHVFLSLLGHAWASCTGVYTMADAVGHAAILRLLPFAASLLAVVFTYRIGNGLGGRAAGFAAALILVTTIPFYNYAAQMRGYSLSMCLFAWLCYAMLQAARESKTALYVTIALSACLTLYTLPSNLYFILALAIAAAGSSWLLKKMQFSLRQLTRIEAALGSGVLMAALLYLPLAKDMAARPIFLPSAAIPPAQALRTTMPVVAYHFLSARYLLIFIMIAALFMRPLRESFRGRRGALLLSVAIVLLLPPLLCDLRSNETPHRVFLTPLPLYAAAAGAAISRVIAVITKNPWRIAAFAGIIIYCIGTCLFQIRKTEAKALSDIHRGERCGDLYFQYNLHYFHPRRDAQQYFRSYYRPGIPLLEACRMDAELLKYLRMEGWQRETGKMPLDAAMAAHDTVDVLTQLPGQLAGSVRQAGNGAWTVTQLLPGERSVQIMRIIRKPLR